MIVCWLKISERKASPPEDEDPIRVLYLSMKKYVNKKAATPQRCDSRVNHYLIFLLKNAPSPSIAAPRSTSPSSELPPVLGSLGSLP